VAGVFLDVQPTPLTKMVLVFRFLDLGTLGKFCGVFGFLYLRA
jgi:hypothetical protein